jgi:hypothetical protein
VAGDNGEYFRGRIIDYSLICTGARLDLEMWKREK